MNLVKALSKYPDVKIFRVTNDDHEKQSKWEVEPVDAMVLLADEGLFIVKAKQVLPSKKIKDCYLDISLPERISDFAYFLQWKFLKADYPYEFPGDIICAVPINCSGDYELFYSKISPETGINILKEGLSGSKEQCHIAEDLGYIYRDEGRFHEATEMFQIAANESPSSYFIFGELAECYEQTGDAKKAKLYKELFDKEGKS